MSTVAVNKNSNSRNLMVLPVCLRIAPLVIETIEEERGNVVHYLISFKFNPSIN